MSQFKQFYRKSKPSLLRPYVEGEPLQGVSISEEDKKAGSPRVGDMIAKNPDNDADRWLVSEAYFDANFIKA